MKTTFEHHAIGTEVWANVPRVLHYRRKWILIEGKIHTVINDSSKGLFYKITAKKPTYINDYARMLIPSDQVFLTKELAEANL